MLYAQLLFVSVLSSVCRSQPAISADPADLALQCQPVVAANNPTAQVTLDPSSYGYAGCSCKDPFVAVVGRTPTGAVTVTCAVQQQQQVCAREGTL